MPQPLSSKESSLFRQLVRNYEDKQYKRGLKAADQILKKNPKHGDTMAMKALIINQQGKTDEAFALGREALMADMKSHICWHVYGLLYRHHRNFEEAIKAYKSALKLEPESVQIQRDLAFLQIQMRDYAGYVQSRTTMLQARSQSRQNWTALAVAYHLAGDLAQAEKVLTTFEESVKSPLSKTDYENSEAVLYKNMIIAEQGDYPRALDHLESAAKHSLDRLAVMELRAEYLVKLGKKEQAAKAYRALLERNSEHPDYYNKLLEVLEIPVDDSAARQAIYDEYAVKNPRADAPKRLPLDFLAGRSRAIEGCSALADVTTGDKFRQAAKSYLAVMLDRAVPSTFANLKHLYLDDFKRDTLGQLAHEYLESKRPGANAKEQINGQAVEGEGAALYYLAQHYNYYVSRDLAKAMKFVDEGIELVPKNVEFHMTKSRIWKHYGNTRKASEIMDEARNLDLRDRYINTKAAKYQLRNNDSEKALETVALFTRNETPGGPLSDLLDMQTVWYMAEDGEAQVRKGNLGLALKRFHTVYSLFDTWVEDQFDFHSFTLRKGQIRAYIEMLRWEDHIRDHPFFTRSALSAVAIYLDIHDRNSPANGVNGSAEERSEDAAERKKAAKKARKSAQKAERSAAEKAAKQDVNKPKQIVADTQPKDDDPHGLKLAATTDPLADATKFVVHLLQYSPKLVNAQLAGFDVYLRRGKFVLALRSLNAARSLDEKHPRVHEQTVSLRHAVNSKLSSLPPLVQELFRIEFTALDGTADLAAVNATFEAQHRDSPAHVTSAVRTRKLLGEDRGACAKALGDVVRLERASFEDYLSVLSTLKSWGSKKDVVEAVKTVAASRWPEAFS